MSDAYHSSENSPFQDWSALSINLGIPALLEEAGPTIRNYPEIHLDSIREDAQCLECHAPENNAGDAPVTSHPDFKGCLNCHNDAVKR